MAKPGKKTTASSVGVVILALLIFAAQQMGWLPTDSDPLSDVPGAVATEPTYTQAEPRTAPPALPTALPTDARQTRVEPDVRDTRIPASVLQEATLQRKRAAREADGSRQHEADLRA